MMSGEDGRGFTLAGILFMLAGLILLVLAAEEALQRAGVLGDQDSLVKGTIMEIDHTGNMHISFTPENGSEVSFASAKISDPPGYDPPYSAGESVTVAYSSSNPEDAVLADPREWIRIALFGLFGALIGLWGWMALRFGAAGALGGIALFLGYATVGETAIAALLGF